MFLKRLELKGFKSFPEKTVLEFNKGITAVVGPNGSGKSNISDAVRWVLGEQSVKNLRGSNKMEDVIFAGTQNRSKLGFAEVSMIIDNCDESFSLPYNEVVITRRLYRSGESEFAINNSLCRLKDIHELFMDTGIGREGYSIVGQGRIDEILSTKSEDRRSIFEEAAGIVKFKTRRFEAERKLEKEKQNLIRIDDIVSELENQIEPLKIQSEKTKKYFTLSERLKLIQINIFLIEINKIESDLLKNEKNIYSINHEISEGEKKSPVFEKLKIELKRKTELNSKEIENINNEIIELRSEKEQTENDIKLILQQIGYSQKNVENFQEETENTQKSILLKKEEKEFITTKKNASLLELETKKENLKNIRKEFENVLSKLDEKEETFDKYNSEIINKMNIRSEIKINIESINSSISQMLNAREQLKKEIDFSSSQKNDKYVRLLSLKKTLSETEEKENKEKTKFSQLENEKTKAEEKIRNEYINRENINKNLNEMSSKFRILSELEKDYEGYYESVKSVLKQRENKNPLFDGICGAVGELINVEKNYEVAIETALGGSIQNIVTKTEKDAGKVIDYLKQNKKGRATFLPMNAVKGKEPPENIKSQILKEKGVINFAKKLIAYSPEFENIFSNLLGRVIVIDNFNNAVDFAKKYNYSYKIVTLDGELLNPGGAITGGSINKKTAGIFSRNREIKAAKEKISSYTLKLRKSDDSISGYKEVAEKINQIIENIEMSLNDIYLTKNDTKNQITQTEETINMLSEKFDSLNKESIEIDKRISEQRKTLLNFEKDFETIEIEISDIQNRLNEYQKEMQSNKNIREESNKKVTELRLEINEIEFNVSSLTDDINRINTEIENKFENIKKNNVKIDSLKKEIKLKETEINNLKNKKNLIEKNSLKKQKDVDSLNLIKANLAAESEKYEKESLEHIEYISKIKNEKVRLELLKEQLEENKTRLCNDIWEKYEITFASAQRFEKLDIEFSKMKSEESKIKNEIRNIGTINTDAVEEYNKVKERYDFLAQQRQDIMYAEKNLKNLISELSTLMEEQFKTQFKIINENFETVFSEIFGGGHGYIKLSDENDVLNSGIEIAAQPPGKNIQNMTLLSGGEKALTAIALLFAILKMKPSPFCILDEIEAALDDANVKRFADYLKRFSDNTQFIIVTHRKGSMEAADTLYGITMQEQGVSKLISVKFTETNSQKNTD